MVIYTQIVRSNRYGSKGLNIELFEPYRHTPMKTRHHTTPSNTHKIEPWVQLIIDGKYDEVDWDTIHEGRFPELKSMTRWPRPSAAQIVKIPRTMYPYEVIEFLNSKGLRPGTIQDLIIWGAVTPKKKRWEMVGVRALYMSVDANGKRFEPEIDIFAGQHLFKLCDCGDVYGEGFNFIALPM